MICVTTIAIIINFHCFCHSPIAFFWPLPPWSSWLSTSSSQSKPLSSFSQSAPTVSVSRARETISRKKEEKVGEQILKSSFLYFYKLSTTTLFISQVQTLNFGDVLFGSSRWMHLSTIKHIKKFRQETTLYPLFCQFKKSFLLSSRANLSATVKCYTVKMFFLLRSRPTERKEGSHSRQLERQVLTSTSENVWFCNLGMLCLSPWIQNIFTITSLPWFCSIWK